MQADTTTLAPTDAEIFALEVAHTKRHETRDCTGYFSEFDIVAFTLSAIAKWGAPAPANFPARITALLHEVKRGPWEDASGEPLQDDAAAALAWIAAPPAQEVRTPLDERDILHRAAGHSHPGTAGYDIELARFVESAHGITAAQKETP